MPPAGTDCMEHHNQEAAAMYTNCAEYGLENSKSIWEIPPKMVETERTKILWDFSVLTDKVLMANQPYMMVVDKYQKKSVAIDF